MDQYNKQASDYIFRENNAVGRVDGDTIDLHGQFVAEAEQILEQRIPYAQSTNQSHLHVYVPMLSHSAVLCLYPTSMLPHSVLVPDAGKANKYGRDTAS